MNYLSVEYLIIYAFLGITALVGSWGTTSKNFKEYAIANRRFGVGGLMMTVLATLLSGGFLVNFPNFTANSGLSGALSPILEIAIPILIVIYLIAPKIVHFKSCMTAGDLMHTFYGEGAQVITGILAFLFCSHVCSRQIMYLSKIFGYLGMDNIWGMALAVGVLAFYTARGGMKAVTLTDILHFVIVFTVIPLVAHLMLHQVGGLQAIFSALSTEQLQLFSTEGFKNNLGTKTMPAGIVTLFFPAFVLGFPFIQRMLMAKHQQQSVGMYNSLLAVFVPFLLVIGVIGLAGIFLYPGTSEPIILRALEELSPFGKGLVWVSLLGVVISTADSFLHVAGVAFAHDALKPLATRLGIKKVNELKFAQYTTFLVAFVGLVGSLSPHIANHSWHNLILRGINLPITVPLLAGVMGLKTDKRTFYVSTAITVAFYTLSLLLPQSDIAADLSSTGSVLVSIFSYLGVHYYYHRGFEIVNRSAYGQTTAVWHPSWQGTKATISDLAPTPQKLVRYFQQKTTENSSNTTTLALFVAVSYMVPLFMHSIGQPEAYNWLLALRIVGALLCVGLLLQSQWPEALVRYFATYYHLALLFCFPLMTTFLLLLEGGSTEWVINVVLFITLFLLLLDYATAILLSVLGIALAVGIYRLGIGPVTIRINLDTQYLLFYAGGFSIIIGILFSRIRERLLRQANRRLLYQEEALEAQLPVVTAENEKRTRAFQQIGIKSLLHVARKLHTIQHKASAVQREQQDLLLSLVQRQQTLLTALGQQQAPQAELLAEQQTLKEDFDALVQRQDPTELTAPSWQQGPQSEPHTLAQQPLTPEEELTSLVQEQQDLQADLLPLVMHLQDLDARGQDHLTLRVAKDLPLDQFLLSLQEKLLPRGIDVPLLTERKTKQQKITVDADKLATLFVKGIAALQWLIHNQDQYLLLGLEDTQLAYPLPHVAQDYVKYIPALRFTITATEQLPPIEASYRPDLTSFVPQAHPTFQTMEAQDDARLIKAHYGYLEVSENTLTYVVPVDVNEVRPKGMDKPELELGAMPVRADDDFKYETVDAQAQEQAFLGEVAAKSTADLGVVKLALNLIKWCHGHKRRHSGEPSYLHPLAVAQIVLGYAQDESTIIGALLHDTIKGTPLLLSHIEAMFGKETAQVVDLATNMQSIEGSMYKIKLSAEEHFQILKHTDDKRVLYVKLADRLHNMRTIKAHKSLSKRKLIAQETMDFFMPLAQKLGWQETSRELEALCVEVFEMQG